MCEIYDDYVMFVEFSPGRVNGDKIFCFRFQLGGVLRDNRRPSMHDTTCRFSLVHNDEAKRQIQVRNLDIA